MGMPDIWSGMDVISNLIIFSSCWFYSQVKAAEADFTHMYNISNIVDCMGSLRNTTQVKLSYEEIVQCDDVQTVSPVGEGFIKKYHHFKYVRSGVVQCKVKKSDPKYITHMMSKSASMFLWFTWPTFLWIDSFSVVNVIVSKDHCRICGDGAEEDDDDVAERSWIQCDKCDQWYHADCLGFENDESSVYYECESCR